MGFTRHIQQEKFIPLNFEIGKDLKVFPYILFKLVKLSLDELLPSRAHLRFTLQNEMYYRICK